MRDVHWGDAHILRWNLVLSCWINGHMDRQFCDHQEIRMRHIECRPICEVKTEWFKGHLTLCFANLEWVHARSYAALPHLTSGDTTAAETPASRFSHRGHI